MSAAPAPDAAGAAVHPLAERRLARAEGLAAEGDHAAAADLIEQALDLAPGWAAGWLRLGEAWLAAGEAERGAAALARADALDPGGALGAGVALAALGGAPPPAALPPAFVRALFDGYAPRFEAHLVGALGYRAPALLRAALLGTGPARRALDLGCGTGLMGVALRDLCGRLEGCDLSPAMLARARAGGAYDRLEAAEAVAFLAGARDDPEGPPDLAVAADTVPYLGDLAPLFAAARAALAPGGRLALTAQALPEGAGEGAGHREGYALGPDRRFAHAGPYLRGAATAAGLAVERLEAASTRRDAGAEVPGWLVVLRAPGAAA